MRKNGHDFSLFRYDPHKPDRLLEKLRNVWSDTGIRYKRVLHCSSHGEQEISRGTEDLYRIVIVEADQEPVLILIPAGKSVDFNKMREIFSYKTAGIMAPERVGECVGGDMGYRNPQTVYPRGFIGYPGDPPLRHRPL